MIVWSVADYLLSLVVRVVSLSIIYAIPLSTYLLVGIFRVHGIRDMKASLVRSRSSTSTISPGDHISWR
jgi:hypothetical protein